MRHEDEHLDFWGEQFMASGMRAVTTFEAFMQWSPQLRERRLAGAHYAQSLQEQIEREVPDAALRNSILVEPIHQCRREHHAPWWHRFWRKVGRNRSRKVSRHAG